MQYDYTDKELAAALAPVMEASKVQLPQAATEEFCRSGAHRLCAPPVHTKNR